MTLGRHGPRADGPHPDAATHLVPALEAVSAGGPAPDREASGRAAVDLDVELGGVPSAMVGRSGPVVRGWPR